MKDISSDMIRDFMKKPITAVSATLASKTAVVETANLEGLALHRAAAVPGEVVKCSPPFSLSRLKVGRDSKAAATLTAIFSTVEGGKMDVVAVQNEIVRLGVSLEGVKLELRLDIHMPWVSPFDDQDVAQ